MAQYRAVDGVPTDWHLRALRRTRQRRRRPGVHRNDLRLVQKAASRPAAPGSTTTRRKEAWKRIVDFVHAETDAKIAIQLGHSGAKGSTQLGWETMDAPLAAGNWEIVAPSPVPWSANNQTPREMTRADMDKVRDDFVRATEMSARIGFDWLGAALRARLPDVVLHHAADQQANGRIRRQHREPHAVSARSVPRRARGVAGQQADLGAYFGQ